MIADYLGTPSCPSRLPSSDVQNDTANKLKDKLGVTAEVQAFNLPEFKVGHKVRDVMRQSSDACSVHR